MTVTISHDAIDGTVIAGTQRGDASRAVLRTYGAKWSRELGAWFLPRSRGTAARTDVINGLAAALRAVGFTVDVEITAVTPAEAEEAREAIAHQRAAGLLQRAERLQGRSRAASDSAHEIVDAIPMGQPILVGHHSERRHRRDLDRHDRRMRTAIDSSQEAQAATRAAAAAVAQQEQRHTMPAIGRRLERLQAEAGDVERRIAGVQSAQPPAAGDYLERMTTRGGELAQEIIYWTAERDRLIAEGAARAWSKADFVKGDRVLTVRGSVGTVVRANAKTLTVNYDVFPASITNPVPYHDVSRRLTRSDPQPQVPDGPRKRPSRLL
jgi:hypothetical protein